MMVTGCDYHPSGQQLCWMDTLTGETGEILPYFAWLCADRDEVGNALTAKPKVGCTTLAANAFASTANSEGN